MPKFTKEDEGRFVTIYLKPKHTNVAKALGSKDDSLDGVLLKTHGDKAFNMSILGERVKNNIEGVRFNYSEISGFYIKHRIYQKPTIKAHRI